MYFWDKHKTITTYYELLSGEVCDRYGLTQMEYGILMFLHNNPQYNTAADEYSCAVKPQIRQTGNRLSGNAGTAYASLLA